MKNLVADLIMISKTFINLIALKSFHSINSYDNTIVVMKKIKKLLTI
jgi:hypothetical protein